MERKESEQMGESVGAGWHHPFKSDARSRSLSEEVVFEKYLEKVRQEPRGSWGRRLSARAHSLCKGPEAGMGLDCSMSCKETVWLRVA